MANLIPRERWLGRIYTALRRGTSGMGKTEKGRLLERALPGEDHRGGAAASWWQRDGGARSSGLSDDLERGGRRRLNAKQGGYGPRGPRVRLDIEGA